MNSNTDKTQNSKHLFIRVFCVVLCAFSLAGCETASFSNNHAQVVAEPDTVSAMLADAADRASTALETLAAVEQAQTPGANIAPVGNAPIELRRAMTINWVGPVDEVTKTLAERASYTFATIGSPPPTPIIVSVDAENKPVIDILRNIGLQLGTKGDIKVNSTERSVEIHYPPNTGPGAG